MQSALALYRERGHLRRVVETQSARPTAMKRRDHSQSGGEACRRVNAVSELKSVRLVGDAQDHSNELSQCPG